MSSAAAVCSNATASLSHAMDVDEACCGVGAQQPPYSHSHSSPPAHLPSLSAAVLDSADVLGLVASFLCHRGSHVGLELENSLIHLALCCRRTLSAVMRDGPWWSQQFLHLTLARPLVSLQQWTCLAHDDDTLALRTAGFGARQREVLRRLLGAEVFERELAAKVGVQRTVKHVRGKSYTHGLDAVGLVPRRHHYIEPVESPWVPSVEVHPQLTPALFDRLSDHLPEPCKRHIVDEPVYKEYRDPDTGEAYNEPFCQWLLGCWDAALLPK